MHVEVDHQNVGLVRATRTEQLSRFGVGLDEESSSCSCGRNLVGDGEIIQVDMEIPLKNLAFESPTSLSLQYNVVDRFIVFMQCTCNCVQRLRARPMSEPCSSYGAIVMMVENEPDCGGSDVQGRSNSCFPNDMRRAPYLPNLHNVFTLKILTTWLKLATANGV